MSDPAQSEETLDALCARIALSTQALRDAAPDAAARAAERALLSDLSRVATILRNDATAIGESLAGVLEPRTPRPEKERNQP